MLRRLPFTQTRHAIGIDKKIIAIVALAAVGAVVVIVNEITEFPLPAPTCEGLNVHVDRLGKLVQENVTAFGKLPVFDWITTTAPADRVSFSVADQKLGRKEP